MSILALLYRLLASLFRPPVPVAAERQTGRPDEADAAEARRRPTSDVTLEQLGIAHWTFHTLL